MKKISILGSTGSIGTQTLDIAREHKEDFEIVALSCGKNIKLLVEQIKEFSPELVSVEDANLASELRNLLTEQNIKLPEIMYGMEGLLAVATIPSASIVVTAIVGMIGIRPTIAAIEAKKDIALANKETLVCAGHIIMPLAKKMGVSILPVDSEHSAIFQSLQGNENNKIARIILTASGGPFRGRKAEDIKDMTAKDALKHPNWSMGQKVTIDSSTLANKGLEVMEAKWLFDVDIDQISVTVHPQSILHSAVEYEDGSVMGQMGVPDMRLPIQYALLYPNRKSLSGKRLDLFEVGALTFEKPDIDTFPALGLALKAGKTGGSLPTVFNAANEVAVARFLKDEIRFFGIPELISKAMDEVQFIENPSVDDILAIEKETYKILG